MPLDSFFQSRKKVLIVLIDWFNALDPLKYIRLTSFRQSVFKRNCFLPDPFVQGVIYIKNMEGYKYLSEKNQLQSLHRSLL